MRAQDVKKLRFYPPMTQALCELKEIDMAKWLFNSKGENIAFVVKDNVFDKNSNFLGKLDGNEIWNSSYIAEIIDNERIAVKTMKPLGLKGLPGLPGLPGMPGLPGLKSSKLFPSGYVDLEIT